MSKQAFFDELRDDLGEAEYLIREEPADHTGLILARIEEVFDRHFAAPPEAVAGVIEQFDFKNKKLTIQITQSLTSDLAGRIAGLFAGGPVGILPAQQSLNFPAPETGVAPAEEDQPSLDLATAPAD